MQNSYLFVFIYLGTYLIAFSQEAISSKIVDKNGNGIPFAAIGIIDKNFGTVTFEDGSFSLEINPNYEGDTLILSAVGYKRKKVAYTQLINESPELIHLKEDIQRLNEVTVTPEKLDYSK